MIRVYSPLCYAIAASANFLIISMELTCLVRFYCAPFRCLYGYGAVSGITLWWALGLQGWLHQYHVVGRKIPSDGEEDTPVYRMRIFAPNPVVAQSRFWYYMRQLKKVKRTVGEIIAVNEIFEHKPTTVKNFGIWLRYKSRSDTINMYKEYRDVTMSSAVEQMYMEMSGRHRARWSAIMVLKVVPLAAKDCKRPQTVQFHSSTIAFPLPHQRPRAPEKKYKSTFKASRPSTFISSKRDTIKEVMDKKAQNAARRQPGGAGGQEEA